MGSSIADQAAERLHHTSGSSARGVLSRVEVVPANNDENGGGTPAGAQNPIETVISRQPLHGSSDSFTPPPWKSSSTPVELGALLEGATLGHFRLEKFVGGGGMGAVFRAIDETLGRTVAVKVLSRDSTDEETLRRFQNEAQSAARLDHENIARVYYVGEDQGLHFIVFEFIEGINIRDLVQQKGPLPLEEAISYVLQVAEALEHASLRNVIHRDIKPSNVLVAAGRRAKLVDMGLARLHQMDSQADDLTASGVTLGTFDYISPEQARDPRTADVRSDLYSLGCTFYYMLTGRPPFPEGTVLQKLLSHSTDEPTDPRALRPDLDDQVVQVLQRLLAKQPLKRFQRPSDLIGQLLLIAERLNMQSIAQNGTVWIGPSPSRYTALERALPWAVPIAVFVGLLLVLRGYQSPQSFEFHKVSVDLLRPEDSAAVSPVGRAVADGPAGPAGGELLRRPAEAPAEIAAGGDLNPASPLVAPQGLGATNGADSANEAESAVPQDSAEAAAEASQVPVADAARPPASPASAAQPATAEPGRSQPSPPAAAAAPAPDAAASVTRPVPSPADPQPPAAEPPDTKMPVPKASRSEAPSAETDGPKSADADATRAGPPAVEVPTTSQPLPASAPLKDAGGQKVPPADSPAAPADVTAIPLGGATRESPPSDSTPAKIVVTQGGGSIVQGALAVSSLAEACRHAQLSGIRQIELHFDGPLEETPLDVGDQELTITNGVGYRPLVVFRPAAAAFASQGAMIRSGATRLNWHGVDVLLDLTDAMSAAFSMFLLRSQASMSLRDCVLTVRNVDAQGQMQSSRVEFLALEQRPSSDPGSEPLGPPAARQVNVSNCILRGQATVIRSEQAAPFRLVIQNSLIVARGWLADVEGSSTQPSVTDGRVDLVLKRVTAILQDGLCRMAGGPPRPYQLDLHTELWENILFVKDSGAPMFDRVGELPVVEKRLDLRGRDNFYPGSTKLLRLRSDARLGNIVDFNFDSRDRLSFLDEKSPNFTLMWQGLPDSALSEDQHTPEHYRLDPSDFNPGMLIPAGVDISRLPPAHPAASAAASSVPFRS